MSAQTLIWLIIVLTGAIDGFALWAQGMSVDWSLRWSPVLVVTFLCVVAAAIRRRNRPGALLFVAFAQICAFMNVGALLTYAAMAASPFPMADASLGRADAVLGFDWLAWHTTVNAHPTMHHAMAWAYASTPWQIGGMLLYFCFKDQPRVDEFMLSGILAIYIAVVVMFLLPAIAAWSQYDNRVIEPWRPDILALRSHTLLMIGDMKGIVSFPSYHTVLSVLLINMTRAGKRLFYPVLALNGLLIASVMNEGSHYFVDMLAGIAVACISILTARFLLAWCSFSCCCCSF